MKLSYRGIHYNQASVAVNAKVEKSSGKYRGQSCQIANFDNLALKHSHSRRVYRGVTYD